MMKVLVLVDHAVGISGPHRNVVGSLNALGLRDDVRVRLLCTRIDPAEPYAHAENIEIFTGYAPHDTISVIGNIRRVVSAAKGCDLIYVPSGLKSHLYAQCAHLSRPVVAGPNVSPLPYFSPHDSPGWIQHRLMSDCWLEASADRRDFVVRSTGRSDVRVVNHGIDLQKWTPEKRNPAIWDRFGVPADGLKLLHVGRDDEPRKGVAQLVEGFAMARAQDPRLQLVIAGRMSDNTMRKMEKTGSAFALGFVSGELLPQLYASADLAIVPSSWENFAFTVLEALASGLPLIATRAGGIKEQITDGESGILVDITDDAVTHRPDAAERIASAILALATDPALRRSLSTGARRRAETHYSEQRLGRDLVNVFRDVCRRPNSLTATGTPAL